MTIQDQILFARKYLAQIVESFESLHRSNTHSRLDSADKQRVNTVFAIQPIAIVNFEAFLREQKLTSTFRSGFSDLLAVKIIEYSSKDIVVRISSDGGWKVKFSKNTDERKWFSFKAIRKFIQWPDDQVLPFEAIFPFIQTHWSIIVRVISATGNNEEFKKLQVFNLS